MTRHGEKQGERSKEGRDLALTAVAGTSRSMLRSVVELAACASTAQQQLDREVIVEIDPKAIEQSFVRDRLDDDDGAFLELVSAISQRGQDSPVLLRPSPLRRNSYQVVFGHRRVRAARVLGVKVKAVVRALDNRAHVVAQGQENSARANLTFIERAQFARNLVELGHERDTICSALAVDAPMLTRLLSVSTGIPSPIIVEIGRAPGIGRDRWLKLKRMLAHPPTLAAVRSMMFGREFMTLSSRERFERLFSAALASRQSRARSGRNLGKSWDWHGVRASASLKGSSRRIFLTVQADDAFDFGRYLTLRMEGLYREFKEVGGVAKDGSANVRARDVQSSDAVR